MTREPSRLDALAQNLRVESALLRVIDALSGIDFVVLKGGLLTRRIYGDLAGRVSGDNDVLIRTNDVEEALTRLQESGYRAAPLVDGARALKRNGRVELWPEGDMGQVTLDLHVRAFDRRLFDEDEDFVWSSLESVELHGRSVRVFNAELSLAHLAAHTLSHFADRSHLEILAHAWARLGSVVDRVRFADVLARTLGAHAFEFALALALSDDPEPRFLGAPNRAASIAARLGEVAGWKQRSTILRGLLTVLAVSPRRLPTALLDAFYPGVDELHARYGPGSSPRLLLRHIHGRIRSRRVAFSSV